MAPAKELLRRKEYIRHNTDGATALLVIDVWDVGDDTRYPQGFKFSFFLVLQQTKEVIIGYDNHYPKGLHKHVGEQEIRIIPVDYLELMIIFEMEVAKLGYTK